MGERPILKTQCHAGDLMHPSIGAGWHLWRSRHQEHASRSLRVFRTRGASCIF